MNLKNKKYLRYFFNVVVPVFVGVVIYIFVRPDTYIARYFYMVCGISERIGQISILPKVIRIFMGCYAADILWAYALTFSVFFVLEDVIDRVLPMFCICAVFEIGMEFLQIFPAFRGTFDLWDIILEISTSAIVSLIIKIQLEDKK